MPLEWACAEAKSFFSSTGIRVAHRDDEAGGDAAGILHGGGEVTALSQRLEASAGGIVELAHDRAQDLAGAHVVHKRDRIRVHRQSDHAVQDARDWQRKLQAAAAAVRRLLTPMRCTACNSLHTQCIMNTLGEAGKD